jgi:hypothetical protein
MYLFNPKLVYIAYQYPTTKDGEVRHKLVFLELVQNEIKETKTIPLLLDVNGTVYNFEVLDENTAVLLYRKQHTDERVWHKIDLKTGSAEPCASNVWWNGMHIAFRPLHSENVVAINNDRVMVGDFNSTCCSRAIQHTIPSEYYRWPDTNNKSSDKVLIHYWEVLVDKSVRVLSMSLNPFGTIEEVDNSAFPDSAVYSFHTCEGITIKRALLKPGRNIFQLKFYLGNREVKSRKFPRHEKVELSTRDSLLCISRSNRDVKQIEIWQMPEIKMLASCKLIPPRTKAQFLFATREDITRAADSLYERGVTLLRDLWILVAEYLRPGW